MATWSSPSGRSGGFHDCSPDRRNRSVESGGTMKHLFGCTGNPCVCSGRKEASLDTVVLARQQLPSKKYEHTAMSHAFVQAAQKKRVK
jgi:hypothetical protein